MNQQEYELQIFRVAEMLLPAFIQAHKAELGDRKGLYIALLKRGTPKTENAREKALVKLIGYIPKEKQQEKMEYAMEKVSRLFYRNMGMTESEIEFSSFESENAEKKEFGGGIRTLNFYIAVSGFPPHLDQKFVLLLSLIIEEMSFHNASVIHTGTLEKQRKWIRK